MVVECCLRAEAEGDDEEGESGGGLYAYLTGLEILCNTWSVAGVFEVDVNGRNAGRRARFCHWAEASEYLLEVTERAQEQLPPRALERWSISSTAA